MIVGGISKDLTAAEADRMAKEAMAAYNEVFSQEKLGAAQATASTLMNDGKTVFTNAQFSLEESVLFGFQGSQADTLSLHKEFENHFCEHLQETGLSVFAQAKDCSFSFLAKPGMTSQVPVKSTYTSSHGSLAQAELILAGLKDGATKADMNFLERVVVESHNEAFAKWGLALGDFDVIADVHVGGFQGWLGQCSPCCNDDEPLCPDDATQNTVTVVAANAMPILAASGMEGFRKVDAEIANNAMDTLVCTKLRNSGIPVFEGVHTCSFQYVYSDISGASTMLLG